MIYRFLPTGQEVMIMQGRRVCRRTSWSNKTEKKKQKPLE